MRSGVHHITDSAATDMSVWQAPSYHAEAHLYDSGDTPKLDAPLVLRRHFGKMKLSIVLNPTMGLVHSPDVMRNEHLIILPRPNNAETMKISVAYMLSGNILIDEISDPRGLVLEARSGRVFGGDQVENEEWLRTKTLVREAERQRVHDYSRDL